MKTLKDKVVAITGAASGIGRSVAVQLAAKGSQLAISDISPDGLEQTRRQCEALGVTTVATVLDVANRADVHTWADATRQQFGKVNVIINNAGVSLGATVEDMSYDDLEWMMNINFWGVVHGTKAFLPHIKDSGDGHVVNVSSVFGIVAIPTQSAYNAAKFAVRGFTEALREEMDIDGSAVGVTCVHPGGIRTNIARTGRIVSNKSWGLKDIQQSSLEFDRVARTTPDQAARDIIAAILKNRRRQLIGADARFIDVLQRLLPTGYQKLLIAGARHRRSQLARKRKIE